MKQKRLDRRVQRTRQLLRDALIALVLEKGYDAVTIQDITDRANLGRATFYLHYRDKEDLLFNSLEETFDELVNRIEPLSAEGLLSTEAPPSLIAFQHAGENRDLYRVLLSGHGAGAVTRRVGDYLATQIQRKIAAAWPNEDFPIPIEILANHMAGSMLRLILWWLENDTPYSAEDMAQAFQKLVTGGIQGVLADSIQSDSTSGR